MEYSDSKETAVCNLASIGLSKFVIQPNVSDDENINIFNPLKFIVKPIVDIVKVLKIY